MKGYLTLIALLLNVMSPLLVLGQTSRPSQDKQIFLVRDAEHKKWCMYLNESDRNSVVASLEATNVGTLHFTSDGDLSAIDVAEEDESGDWVVYDHYVIDINNHVLKDERRINILPGDRAVEESYLIKDGRATKEKSITRSLSTGKELSDHETWLPDVRVITRIGDFPFSPLVAGKYSEMSSKDKACTASKSP
jgi:hypothetical protein